MVHVIPKFILILDLGRFYREHLPPYKGVHPGLWLFILSGAMEVVGLVGLTIVTQSQNVPGMYQRLDHPCLPGR